MTMNGTTAFKLYLAFTFVYCYTGLFFVVWHSQHPATGVRIGLTVVLALAFLGTAALFVVPVLRGGSRS